jgi:hypothetical protein
MKKEIFYLPVLTLFLILPREILAQDTLKLYVNGGYLTSFIQPEGSTKPDDGGSIRIGILTQKRMGYYIGYAWFKEYHNEFAEYDDEGKIFLAGVDFRLLGKKDIRCYLNAGLAFENFISTYRNTSVKDTEFSPKPDLGLLFNLKFVNLYFGWQPSDPAHYILGLGFTLNLK